MQKNLYTLLCWLAPFLAALIWNGLNLLATADIQRLPPASEILYLKGTFLPLTGSIGDGRVVHLATKDKPSGSMYFSCPYYSIHPLPKCKRAVNGLIGREVEVSYYLLNLSHKGTRQVPILLSVKEVGEEVGPLNKEDALLPYHEARNSLAWILSIILALTGVAYVVYQFFNPKESNNHANN